MPQRTVPPRTPESPFEVIKISIAYLSLWRDLERRTLLTECRRKSNIKPIPTRRSDEKHFVVVLIVVDVVIIKCLASLEFHIPTSDAIHVEVSHLLLFVLRCF